MGERKLPRGLPRGAKMRKITVYEGGAWAYFYARGRRVAWVHWNPDGAIHWERYFDAKGKKHGPEIYRHDNGRVSYRVSWRHGERHGKAQQWDERGKLLIATTFRNGSGLDVWWCDGIVAEVRGYVDGKLHGLEQWWADRKTVFVEGGWSRGRKHGIWRMWGAEGKLDRDGPQFYVRGRRVSFPKYLEARANDPTLPAYKTVDDRPTRAMGAAVKAVSRPR
jgi:antitoxin component YwqK of YwqJK toxin-antitoxin module